jgi:hypothetical protein
MDLCKKNHTRFGHAWAPLTSEKADSHWEKIFKCCLKSWQGIPINIISPRMFHLNRVESGEDDSSSKNHPGQPVWYLEAHLEASFSVVNLIFCLSLASLLEFECSTTKLCSLC